MSATAQAPVTVSAGATPAVPSLLYGQTVHTRNTPLKHRFTYSYRPWLIDVDQPPNLPAPWRRLSRFEPADHLSRTASRSVREEVELVLAEHGVEFAGGRILMLAHPRAAGTVFNPLSVFWCLDDDGSLGAVVLEVHNTYGDRHVYVIEASGDGGPIEKRFYVSPFNPVAGEYNVTAALEADRLRVRIELQRNGEGVFSASVGGRLMPLRGRAQVRAAIAGAFAGYRTAALIRLQGIQLWLRRLPVQPRPTDHPEVLQ